MIFIPDITEKSVERLAAKQFIRREEFKLKHPNLKGEKLDKELSRINAEAYLDFRNAFCHKPHNLEVTKLCDNIGAGVKMDIGTIGSVSKVYKPKPYYDEIPAEYEALIDEHYGEVKKDVKPLVERGLVKKTDAPGWLEEEYGYKSCEDQAVAKVLELFRSDKENVLGKQFENTVLKTAIAMKKDADYQDTKLKSMEEYVSKQQKKLASSPKIEEMKKLYEAHGLGEDNYKISEVIENLETKKLNYYQQAQRLKNSEASAVYLLASADKQSQLGFGVEDAAVAWVFDKLAGAVKDKNSPEYSRLNISNQVNKLMDPKVAGGTDVPLDELQKRQSEKEAEINEVLKKTLVSGLPSQCLSEMGLDQNCDESLVDVKTKAFAELLRQVSIEMYGGAESKVFAYGFYGKVDDFFTTVEAPKKTITKAKPQSQKKSAPESSKSEGKPKTLAETMLETQIQSYRNTILPRVMTFPLGSPQYSYPYQANVFGSIFYQIPKSKTKK